MRFSKKNNLSEYVSKLLNDCEKIINGKKASKETMQAIFILSDMLK